MPDARRAGRLRVNWVTPLPPAHTDIAHYTLRTLPALARHADLVVWTERRYWPPELEAHAGVRRWAPDAWREFNRADATVYHLGNNVRFHSWIWDIASRSPGIVVLHDTRLHEFFAGQLLERAGGPRDYLAAVRRCHGDEAVLQAGRFLRGELPAGALAHSVPLTGLAVERARGAVVHTAAAFAEVAQLARCPVLQLDLPYPSTRPVVERTWDGTLRLIVFGYLGANRRLAAVLEAIAASPHRSRITLEIFGEIEDAPAVADRIGALGLGDRVTLAGFAPEAELDRALDRAHLAVNLRNPSMGEASGSQLRIWSRGLASVVSRTGWYAELPADTVWFADPSSEVADLQAHVERALAAPDRLAAMGAAGRRRLEACHDPGSYAAALVDGIERMMATPASLAGIVGPAVGRVLARSGIEGGAKTALARRAAGELARWMSG